MITNCFSVIRKNFIKKKLNQFIFFNNLNINKATYIKKIAIWLMCKKNNKSICTKCMSCLNFKKNTNTDYYEVIEDNDDNILLKIDFFLKSTPIYSNIKVIFLFIKNKNIISKLTNSLINKNIYFLIIPYYNETINSFSDTDLIFNNKNNNNFISINIIKNIYYSILQKKYINIFVNFASSKKIIVINSLIYFFTIYLTCNNKKKIILMNEYVKNKILKKNIYFLLNLLFKYKKILSKNDNLNIFFIINFIINYINS